MADLTNSRIKTLTKQVSNTPQLNVSGGSTVGDIAQGASFLLDLYQQGQAKKGLQALQASQDATQAEIELGNNAALNVLTLFEQGVSGIKLEEAQRKAISSISPNPLAKDAYFKRLKEAGIKSQARVEQDTAEAIRQKELEMDFENRKNQAALAKKGFNYLEQYKMGLELNGYSREKLDSFLSDDIFTQEEAIEFASAVDNMKAQAEYQYEVDKRAREKYRFDQEVTEDEREGVLREVGVGYNEVVLNIEVEKELASRSLLRAKTPEDKVEAGKLLESVLIEAERKYGQWKQNILKQEEYKDIDLTSYDEKFKKQVTVLKDAFKDLNYETLNKERTAQLLYVASEKLLPVSPSVALKVIMNTPLQSYEANLVSANLAKAGDIFAQDMQSFDDLYQKKIFPEKAPYDKVIRSEAEPEDKADTVAAGVASLVNPYSIPNVLNPDNYKSFMNSIDQSIEALGLEKTKRMVEKKGGSMEDVDTLSRTYIANSLAKGIEQGNSYIEDMKILEENGKLVVKGKPRVVRQTIPISSIGGAATGPISGRLAEDYRRNTQIRLNEEVEHLIKRGWKKEEAIYLVLTELHGSIPSTKPEEEVVQ